MHKLAAALGAALWLASIPAHADSPFGFLWKGWEQVGETDGIKIYKRASPGTPLLDFGGEGVLDGDLTTLCSVLEELERYPEWVDSLSRLDIVDRRNPRDFVYLQTFALPWPISDRQFLARHKINVMGERNFVLFTDETVTHAKAPDDECCIRATMELGEVRMAPVGEKKTAMAAIARVDMKGWMPAWLVNVIQKDWPTKTFSAYRAQLAKQKRRLPQCENLLPLETKTASTAAR